MDANSHKSSSNVLRPQACRWLCGSIVSASGANRVEALAQSSGTDNVCALPAPEISSEVSHEGCIRQLNAWNSVLLADCNEWSDRRLSAARNLDRANQQLGRVVSRLSLVGEAIPDESTRRLSPLQDSFNNFAMAVKLQEKKLQRAVQRIESLHRQRAAVVKEMLARSADLRDQPEDDCPDCDIKEAA